MSDDKVRKQAAVRRLRGQVTVVSTPTLDSKRRSRTFNSRTKSTAARLTRKKKR